MSRPTIRHMAIRTADPVRLAKFYSDVFDMEVLHESKGAGGEKAVFVTDGYLTLALLPLRLEGSSVAGLEHFGFRIDDAEEISSKLVDAGVPAPKPRPSTRPYAETRGMDPDCNLFDLSVHGYQDVETRADRDRKETERVGS